MKRENVLGSIKLRKQITCLWNRHVFDGKRNLRTLENEWETCSRQREMEREARGMGLWLRKRGNSLQCGEGGITPHCLGEGTDPLVAKNVVVEAE